MTVPTAQHVVHGFDSFARLPGAWREFVERRAESFDQSLPWYDLFEKHLVLPGASTALIGLVTSDGRTPESLLALQTAKFRMPARVEASGLSSLSNFYTAHFGLIAGGPLEQRGAAALVDAIIRDHEPDVVDLNPLDADRACWQTLGAEFARRGYAVERYFRFGNWYLDELGRKSEDYFRELPGQIRSTLQRKGKKLRSRSDASIRVITDARDVDAGMDAYEAVYRGSWKRDEPYAGFIREFAHVCADRGWLRLGLIELGGQPVAAQLWFVYRGTASIFKLAYDQAHAELSAGSILTETLMRHVIDTDRVTTVDYLCGDDHYKRDWMSGRRERIGLRAVRRASIAGMVQAAVSVAKRLRTAVRPSATAMRV